MELTEFLLLVQRTFPPSAAMQGDPIGLQVDSVRGTSHCVLIAMELTDDVLAEAVHEDCDTILVFHPLVYQPLTVVQRRNRAGRLVADLIRHDIALIVVHTAFDAHPLGTNHLLAERLALGDRRPLVPHLQHHTNNSEPMNGYGMGLIGSLDRPTLFTDLVERIATMCGSPVRFSPSPTPQIQRIAVVGGSGMSFYEAALHAGADVLITADIRYHDFHAAQGHLGLIDPGHYEMEQFVARGIQQALQPVVPASVRLFCSRVVTNPVRYFSPLPIDTVSHH